MPGMRTQLLFAFLLSFAGTIQAAVPSANDVIAQAGKKASAEKKAVYLRFSASWCGWCKRHDAFLDQPAIKAAFEKYFVPVKLIVEESEANKALENPGAEEWLKKAGGPDGLPYSAFLDPKGKVIVNSKRVADKGGGNVGHPIAPEEVDWFIIMMKKAAPSMASEDLKVIETALRSQVR